MWVFWIVAGGLAAAAAAIVIARAAAAARAVEGAGEDPAMPVYRRQLEELDSLAERGLLGPQEHRAARTEAARRLLSASQSRKAEDTGGRTTRLVVTLGAAGAGLTALALYLLLGSPGLPDQPYHARIQAWRAADPASLGPAQMAAVLGDIASQRPRDPQVFDYLGRAELASGDGFAAARAFQHAAALSPANANLQAELGEALVADGDGKVTPQAAAAFLRAVALDRDNAPARYYLGRAAIAAGDVAGGLAGWRALAAQMAAADPRRAALVSEIDHVAAPNGLGPGQAPSLSNPGPSAGGTPSQATGQMAFIRAMVANQAADLRAHPDNPDGWARLVRSYGVLGDRAAQDQAFAQAQKLFAGRPDVIARIKAEATAAVPTTMPGAPNG